MYFYTSHNIKICEAFYAAIQAQAHTTSLVASCETAGDFEGKHRLSPGSRFSCFSCAGDGGSFHFQTGRAWIHSLWQKSRSFLFPSHCLLSEEPERNMTINL